jgi:hypothetical protein
LTGQSADRTIRPLSQKTLRDWRDHEYPYRRAGRYRHNHLRRLRQSQQHDADANRRRNCGNYGNRSTAGDLHPAADLHGNINAGLHGNLDIDPHGDIDAATNRHRYGNLEANGNGTAGHTAPHNNSAANDRPTHSNDCAVFGECAAATSISV